MAHRHRIDESSFHFYELPDGTQWVEADCRGGRNKECYFSFRRQVRTIGTPEWLDPELADDPRVDAATTHNSEIDAERSGAASAEGNAYKQ